VEAHVEASVIDHTRSTHGGAQEIRPKEGAKENSVLEALMANPSQGISFLFIV
jgi:hypothetical protein